ncbi:MAG: class D sortase [Atopobiaceae bacterium]|nr:class D sortase [Atopobiaceae bacterium]
MVSNTVAFLVADEAPSFSSELTSIYDPEALTKAKEKTKTDKKESNTAAPTVIKGEDVQFPLSGEQYGQITCDQIGLNAPVYWYDDDEILAYGVGQSLISNLPGFGQVIILSGHNNTFFACLQNAAVGNVIKFGTNYCEYEYTVTNVQVYNEDDLESLLLQKVRDEREELILYTCYPFHAITGRKTDRLVVFADRTAGLDVQWREPTT